MRVDYYHTGGSKEERFSLDRIVIEPLPWPGHPRRVIDDTNLGKYLFWQYFRTDSGARISWRVGTLQTVIPFRTAPLGAEHFLH